MGVLPEHHRGGHRAGHARAAETWLAERDIDVPAGEDAQPALRRQGYAATRAFYFGCGFRPLEEMPDLWGRDSPALQMIKNVRLLPGRPTTLG